MRLLLFPTTCSANFELNQTTFPRISHITHGNGKASTAFELLPKDLLTSETYFLVFLKDRTEYKIFINKTNTQANKNINAVLLLNVYDTQEKTKSNNDAKYPDGFW